MEIASSMNCDTIISGGRTVQNSGAQPAAAIFCGPQPSGQEMLVVSGGCSHVVFRRNGSPCGHIQRMGSCNPCLALQKGADEMKGWLSMHVSLSIVINGSCKLLCPFDVGVSTACMHGLFLFGVPNGREGTHTCQTFKAYTFSMPQMSQMVIPL